MILVWIDGSLPDLIILDLQSNRFSGSICLELCQYKENSIIEFVK